VPFPEEYSENCVTICGQWSRSFGMDNSHPNICLEKTVRRHVTWKILARMVDFAAGQVSPEKNV
jgi:hypothetical protein